MRPQPPDAAPGDVRPLGPEEFKRWYGGWAPLDPTTIADFMTGFDRPWWIIGGWSLEAFTGIHRDHEDMDISILSSDAEAFRLFLGGRWTNKRNPDHTEDLDDVTWVAADGLRYQRPEVTLMFKAAQAREKDRHDAHVALPRLDEGARSWLRQAVARIDPHHEWAHLR